MKIKDLLILLEVYDFLIYGKFSLGLILRLGTFGMVHTREWFTMYFDSFPCMLYNYGREL